MFSVEIYLNLVAAGFSLRNIYSNNRNPATCGVAATKFI